MNQEGFLLPPILSWLEEGDYILMQLHEGDNFILDSFQPYTTQILIPI